MRRRVRVGRSAALTCRGRLFCHVTRGMRERYLSWTRTIQAEPGVCRSSRRSCLTSTGKRAFVCGSARECAVIGGGDLGEEFQGYGLAEGQVGGAVDLAHAAASQQSGDAVARGHHGAGQEAAFIDGAAGAEGGAVAAAAPRATVSAEVASRRAAQEAQYRLVSAHSWEQAGHRTIRVDQSYRGGGGRRSGWGGNGCRDFGLERRSRG